MASGIMPEATPVELVETAAAAGFDYGGMWIEPDQWTDQTTKEVRAAIQATGLPLLDVEVVWLQPGPADPEHMRIVDIAAELGARNILCVSSDPERGSTRDKLGRLMERAEGTGVRINLEFAMFLEIRTIQEASALLSELTSPDKAMLLDSLHWQRSGGTLEDIANVPREWLSYIQLCDAAASVPPGTTPDALLQEAIDDRVALGAGGLPLRDIIALLPEELPIAVEERSKALRASFPDIFERAAEVYRTSSAFLQSL